MAAAVWLKVTGKTQVIQDEEESFLLTSLTPSYTKSSEIKRDLAHEINSNEAQLADKIFNLGKQCFNGTTGAGQVIQKKQELAQLGHNNPLAGQAYLDARLKHLHSDDTVEDYDQAFNLYKQAISLGYYKAVKGVFELGNAYRFATNPTKDMTKALKCFELAANQRHQEAALIAGNMYEVGDGCPKDVAKALEFFNIGKQQN